MEILNGKLIMALVNGIGLSFNANMDLNTLSAISISINFPLLICSIMAYVLTEVCSICEE
jgi:hypothetical protein